jgi:uncharacterized membrane protein YraQ (UPF0718 family)
MSFLTTIGKGLQLAAEMAWATWWALVLGFTIAGAVEAFVSEDKMGRALGGRGLRGVGLGTLFGAASSSCSFGAVATAKSLFKKGASPEASLGAFQFASTNLVIELGLVMWVLLGWQFVAANFLSGLILIALLVLAFRWIIPERLFERARRHVKENEGVRDPNCGMEVDPDGDDTVALETESGAEYFCSRSCRDAYEEKRAAMTVRDRLMTRKGWRNAFQNAIGEWAMLWKDIAAGFVIAGLIAAFVPRSWWTTLFGLGMEGSFAQVALCAVIGVAVGVITFVCSVGNVPFALILWQNGIPFGAVMSFIFADLIVPTITDAYRRYYGWRMAAALFGAIFACAVIAGIIIHYVWHALGLVPPKGQPGGVAPSGYTLYLNIVFTVLFIAQLVVRFMKR